MLKPQSDVDRHDIAVLEPIDRIPLLTLAISGVAYVVCLFGPQPDGPPVATATAEQIRAFLISNTAAIKAGAFFGALLVATIVVWTAAMSSLARRHPDCRVLADVVLGAGLLTAVVPLIETAVSSMTLVQGVDGTALDTVDGDVLRSWYAISNVTHFLGDLWVCPIALLTAAGSLVLLRSRMLPRWVAVLGLTVAAGGSIGLIAYVFVIPGVLNAWFIGLVGWILWSLAVSALAARAARRLRTRDMPAAAE